MASEALRQFSLDEIAPIFPALERLGHPCVLFGGQSVCLWALRFLPTEPALQKMRRLTPLVSKDVDFQGSRDSAIALARALGSRAEVPDERQAFGNLMAGKFSIGVGPDSLKVEVLRKVPGLSANEVQKLSLLDARGDTTVKVLNPVAVMMAKAWNVANIPPEGRRDAEQLLVTIICARAFLRSLLSAAGGDRPSVRLALKLVECALAFAESSTASKAADRCGVDWSQMLPHAFLSATAQPELVRLREKRLPLWLARMSRHKSSTPNNPTVGRLLEILAAHSEPLCAAPSTRVRKSL